MEKHKIHYCFTLSDEQVEFLRSKKYKIDRMECFMSLVTLAERETRLVQVSKTQKIEILPGQFMVDNTQLSKLWDKDRKTVPKLLEAIEKFGISSSCKVRDYRVHTLHSLSGWYVDGRFQKNSFGYKRQADGDTIFHAEVPPPRLIVTKEAVASNKGKDDSISVSDISPDDSEGVISPTDVITTLQNSHPDDTGSVGKVADTNEPSSPLSGGISTPTGATIPQQTDHCKEQGIETKGSLTVSSSHQSGGQVS